MDSHDQEEKKIELSRRDTLKLTALGLLSSLPFSEALAKAAPTPTAAHGHMVAHPKPNAAKTRYLFLQKNEVIFLEAAVARLIPNDEKWGGALEAGVVNYIDLQLGGSWGAGERLYRSGPWIAGNKNQGYQLPFTPAELFRNSFRALAKDMEDKKIVFEKLSAADQDTFLKKLESSTEDFGGVPGKTFFSFLWQMTMEGYFADPTYGGNKNMVSWRMIGFPGAFASYYDLVDKHGIKINRPPMSLAQDTEGMMHLHPNTSAK